MDEKEAGEHKKTKSKHTGLLVIIGERPTGRAKSQMLLRWHQHLPSAKEKSKTTPRPKSKETFGGVRATQKESRHFGGYIWYAPNQQENKMIVDLRARLPKGSDTLSI